LGAVERPRSSPADWPLPTRKPVQTGRFLVLIAFCLGVVVAFAWQSYGDAAREMIANLSPRLSWLAPMIMEVRRLRTGEIIRVIAPRDASAADLQSLQAMGFCPT
jgi:hypothetical protein